MVLLGNVTVADALADPNGPLQVSVNVVVCCRSRTTSAPRICRAPLHPLEAAQAEAFVLSHMTVAEPPGKMLAGVADSVTVGD